ncbi:SDR family NAD(P)-dependent oxidoreductase [Loigolactobacillus binensis]|uniref:SDR family NAD(P)-dependent oxidoreductase n=1 Tax=Loigolactobacillus binensis TaxID=2559922 RepID=A0ABW3EB10_9LACO|nr:SDR family oxidoreductase [Loigolactobacillus binensis]
MTNKIALVTGGSRGLGRSTAFALAQKGLAVVITYHSQQEQAAAVVAQIEQNGGQAAALQLDTGVTASFAAFAEQLTAVLTEKWQRQNFDFLVNNAGFGLEAGFAETTEAQFDSLMNVHFKGVYFLTQTLLPLLADQGGIVNVSSGLTRFTTPGGSAYAAMKGAIEVLSRYLAKELGPRGIRVNTVAPGLMATDFGGGAAKDNDQLRGFIGSATTLGRIGEAEDVSGVIAALCTDELKWVDAQRIEASGGMFL